MILFRYFILFLFFVHNIVQCQTNYFIPPVKIPIVLSGNFGELRSNHFHAGLDIKTQGRTGIDTHASASGYVSRIKISHFGYGKALYIQHPNGMTTVYAHLEKFSPKIEAYVKKHQYKNESYTIELFPEKGVLNVSQDEVIGFTGNSGGSGGPHLHFEIRDASQRPMNPMSFGIEIADSRKPLVNSIWLYPISEDAQINGQMKPYRLKIKSNVSNNITTLPVEACGEIGVAINSVDQHDAAYNKNGVYKINSKVNGVDNFSLEMNKFSFSESRYINYLIDYEYYKKHRSRIIKLFVPDNNPLSVFNRSVGDGVINVQDSLTYSVNLAVQDFKENTTTLNIQINGKSFEDLDLLPEDNEELVTYPNEKFTYTCAFAEVEIPAKALYEKQKMQIKVLDNNTLKVHNNFVPLHKKMTLNFTLDSLSSFQRFIGKVSSKGKVSYVGSKVLGDKIQAKTKEFGTFKVCRDSIQPKIRPINFSDKKWITSNKTLKLYIEDLQSGIKSYKATINGKFALMEYDYKKGTIVYNFEDGVSVVGENKLRVFVEDNVGNSAIFESIFYRNK